MKLKLCAHKIISKNEGKIKKCNSYKNKNGKLLLFTDEMSI